MNKRDINNFAHRATPETLGDFPVQPGDEVIWTSQAGSSTTAKRGVVLYVGRKSWWGQRPGLTHNVPQALGDQCGRWLDDAAKERYRQAARGRHQYDTPAGFGVLVEVSRISEATGKPLASWFYSPRMTNLQRVSDFERELGRAKVRK
jgi:hypothetical protein